MCVVALAVVKDVIIFVFVVTTVMMEDYGLDIPVKKKGLYAVKLEFECFSIKIQML